MNIPLLLKVKAAILAEPRKFDMNWWFINNEESPCGTTACIAGWAVAIHGRFKSLKQGYALESHPCRLAERLLKLDESISRNLFHVEDWPSEFSYRYDRCKTPRGRAKVAADRIDRFIETEGRV